VVVATVVVDVVVVDAVTVELDAVGAVVGDRAVSGAVATASSLAVGDVPPVASPAAVPREEVPTDELPEHAPTTATAARSSPMRGVRRTT
jgi:hypothetical protein